jgi:hypothetical protein
LSGDGSEFKKLYDDVAELQAEMRGLRVELNSQSDKMTEISSTLHAVAAASKTNWGTLAAWATVIVGAMVFYTNLSREPLAQSVRQAKELALIYYQQQADKVEDLDAVLQREMRQLDDTIDERIQSLDGEVAVNTARTEKQGDTLSDHGQRLGILESQILDARALLSIMSEDRMLLNEQKSLSLRQRIDQLGE